MNLTDLLDRPIAYHRVFVTLTGSVKAAILLSQAMYWQKRAKQTDGWWYKTAEEWQEETGLTRHEQDNARKSCEKYLKTELRDVPARLYWRLDEGALSADLFDGKRQTSLTESGKLDSRKAANINRNAETTTETTTRKPKFSDPSWDLQHGVTPSVEGLEASKMTEVYTDVANRLSEGFRLGEFPQSLQAQQVYRWISEREKEGQKLEAFISWVMQDERRATYAFMYHKSPADIKRDWPRVFPKKATSQGGSFYG